MFFAFFWSKDNLILIDHQFNNMMSEIISRFASPATYKKFSIISHMIILGMTRVNNVSIICQKSKKRFFSSRNSV